MKAVPKVNAEGFYVEDTIVSATFSGVTPVYGEAPPQAEERIQTLEEVQAPIEGYIVGVPVPSGLYLPRFDLEAWQAYQGAYDRAEQALRDATNTWYELPNEEKGTTPMPVLEAPLMPDLWVEGLTPEELDAAKNPPPIPPTRLDLIGAQLVNAELAALRLQQQNNIQGNMLVGMDLRVTALEKTGGA